MAHHGAMQEAQSRRVQARGSTPAAAPAGCAAVRAEPHDPARCLAWAPAVRGPSATAQGACSPTKWHQRPAPIAGCT